MGFGCVLYEMLAGRAAFSGATSADTIAAILQREPEWETLPPTTTAAIRNLLIRCLAKESDERLRDIGEVRRTIEAALSGSGVKAPAVVQPSRTRMKRPPKAAIAAVVLVAAGVAVWTLRSPSVEWRMIGIEPQTLDQSGGAHVVASSHKGDVVAYVAAPRLLYILPMNGGKARSIQESEYVQEPVFSPDDKDIAFYSFGDQAIKRMPVAGGIAMKVCPASTPTGIDWYGEDIYFGQGKKGILKVSQNSGLATTVASVENGQEAHGPQVLPGGKMLLFTLAEGTARDRWDTADIVVQPLNGRGERKKLLKGSDARYVRSGHLVYAVSGRLFAVAFDLEQLKTIGSIVPVVEGVSRGAGGVTGAANFSVSDDGLMVYVPGPVSAAPAANRVALIDIDPKAPPEPLNLRADPHESVRVSPDETRIAYTNANDKDSRVYIYEIGSSASEGQPLTTSGSNSRFPVWAKNERVAFQSDSDVAPGKAIWLQSADFSGDANPLTVPKTGESHIPESWFNDTLVYSVTKEDMVWLESLTMVNGKPRLNGRFGKSTSTDPMSAVFSSDGALVAYTMTDKGRTTICVEEFPVGRRDCLSPPRGDTPKHPRWSKDDAYVYFDPRFGDFEKVRVERQPRLQLATTAEPVGYHPSVSRRRGSERPTTSPHRAGSWA